VSGDASDASFRSGELTKTGDEKRVILYLAKSRKSKMPLQAIGIEELGMVAREGFVHHYTPFGIPASGILLNPRVG